MATSFPTGSFLASCSHCSWTLRSWIPGEGKKEGFFPPGQPKEADAWHKLRSWTGFVPSGCDAFGLMQGSPSVATLRLLDSNALSLSAGAEGGSAYQPYPRMLGPSARQSEGGNCGLLLQEERAPGLRQQQLATANSLWNKSPWPICHEITHRRKRITLISKKW